MLEAGQQPPEYLIEPPPSRYPDVDNFYLEAFYLLSTERQQGWALGPIPWSSMIAYANREELSREAADVFVTVLRVLDRAVLDDERAAAKAQKKTGGQP